MKHEQYSPDKESRKQESITEGSLIQRYEEVFRELGIDPKWDNSMVGQSVIMPALK
jgi:hypothetical protein